MVERGETAVPLLVSKESRLQDGILVNTIRKTNLLVKRDKSISSLSPVDLTNQSTEPLGQFIYIRDRIRPGGVVS